jgi:hypothetical protein
VEVVLDIAHNDDAMINFVKQVRNTYSNRKDGKMDIDLRYGIIWQSIPV